MGNMDFQLGVATETTFNTGVTVTRFYEYDTEAIKDDLGRTMGDPLRTGSAFQRLDRATPYYKGAAGDIEIPVMTQGFGWWFTHMFGAVTSSTTATDSLYTHSGAEASLYGKSFTAQVNRPFHPSGTSQAFTFTGGKLANWELSNAVDGNLLAKFGCDFAQQTTATALATASYETGMDNLTWAGGVITIGGSAYDVTEFTVKVDNGLKVDRHQIRGNTDKKEQTSHRRKVEWSLKADFESLAERNYAIATTRAGTQAAITATWTGPTLAGASSYPSLEINIPAAQFDDWEGATNGPDGIEQSLSGVGWYDGSTGAILGTYKSIDSTA